MASGSGTLSRCCPLSGIVPGHEAWSWVSVCCFSVCVTDPGLTGDSYQQGRTCCVQLVLSFRHCPSASEKPRRLLLVNCPRPMYPEAQALVRSKTSLLGLEPRRTHSGRPAPFPLGCLTHDLGCLLTHNLPKTLNPGSGGLDGFLGTQTSSKIEPRPFSSSSHQPTDLFSPFGKQLALTLFCSNL